MKQSKIKKIDNNNQGTGIEISAAEKGEVICADTYVPYSLQRTDPDLQEILNFQQECLIVHNKYRQKHKVKPLDLNEMLCNLAQQCVDRMANSGIVQQFKNINYGLNMFVASGTMYNADDIIKSWYSEVDTYAYSKPGLTDQTRHFTQIIWKSTKLLGVGIRKKNRHTWVVCLYDPSGNKVGGFCENVLPPTVQNSIVPDITSLETINKHNEFIKDCLHVHNKYRAKHGCPPLRLNSAMNDYAKEWAIELSKYGSLRHRVDNVYGENLFLAANYHPTAEEVVKEWYDEIQWYDYKKPNFTKETGNFTQVIWKDSVDLGVGIYKSGISTYIVCNYAPHGNILERFKQNVPPTLDDVDNISEISSYSEERLLSKVIVNEVQCLQDSLKQRKTFEEQCLNSHNKYRALHGCPPLVLDKMMSAYAQEWSEYLAKNKSLEHRPNNPYGENLFYATFHITGQDPVQKWYQEIKHYDFKHPAFHPSTGHFTQLIWKKTKRLGVGITIFNKITFVVCNYDPWGNVLNHFDKNVPPLLVKNSKLFVDVSKEQVNDVKPLKSVEVRCLKVTNSGKKNTQNKQPQSKQSQSTKQTSTVINSAKFEELCLETHNKYRKLHGCPPLKVAKYLNEFAMEWAKHLSKTKKFEHRPDNKYGENLYFGSGFRVGGADPVITWYNEIHDFDFAKPGFQTNTGHFTQLIWKESKEVGVAVINLGENTYVVCNYFPPGNVIGAFEENVPAALEGPFSLAELKKRNFASATDPKQFAQEVLQLHNFYRAKHNSPPLKLSEDLNKLASEWANHLAETNTLQHRQPPKYGENIFKASGWNITPDELMRMWYNESKVYKFDQNEFVPNAGHFTQLIWKNSKMIGVGTAKRDRSMWIVVNYDPPGNFAGEFKDNVPQAIQND